MTTEGISGEVLRDNQVQKSVAEAALAGRTLRGLPITPWMTWPTSLGAAVRRETQSSVLLCVGHRHIIIITMVERADGRRRQLDSE